LRDNITRGPASRVRMGSGVQMAIVTIRDGEPPEGILTRFRAAVTRGGILKEHKDRKFFRSKGEKERLAARRSARRRRRVTAR
jgi:ribosomal protein S21